MKCLCGINILSIVCVLFCNNVNSSALLKSTSIVFEPVHEPLKYGEIIGSLDGIQFHIKKNKVGKMLLRSFIKEYY